MASLVALYVTICSVLFIASKMLISFLLYKRWARKKRIIDNSLAGGKMVILGCNNNKALQSVSPKSFLGMLTGLSSKDVIGAGGYGTVYRLRVGDSCWLAVKRLNRGSAEMERGFERELEAMADIKHRNIVPLCGYYAAPHLNLLIYELMPNGSLDALLHLQQQQQQQQLGLGWERRYRIALGVARGLSYLHHDCIPAVIHRDIKSSNILLDHRMEARLSDFGLATLITKPGGSHVTTLVAGTFGYLAPEYFDTGRATTKGDVYSYGVLLLELLTGKRPTDESFLENGTRLVTWVKEATEDKRHLDRAVDQALLPLLPAHDHQLRLVFSVADKCLDSDPANRPTMAQVVNMLHQT
ncbi:unnamed protein product [Urochloa decumbens]|uniref:Protein kinase domain-containing protein n=1 Tax=Urochloa decumbens TaxID=240449 RepID=A0ABC9AHK0_9POAL